MAEHPSLHGDVVAADECHDLLAIAAAFRDTPLFYWEQPARGLAIVAVGALREIRAVGPARFAATSAAARALLAAVESNAEEWRGGYVVGGFGFADQDSSDPEWRDFPAARLVLPPLLWIRSGGHCTVTRIWEAGGEHERDALCARARAATSRPRPLLAGSIDRALAADPSPDERTRWCAHVDAARALIAAGRARKIVVARRRELVTADAELDPARLLAAARAHRPGCFSFWIRPHGGASLVGSTPELLVRRSANHIEASALAGSAARATGNADDERLAVSLLSCPKNGREHASVVAAVRSAVAGIAVDVVTPDRPQLLSVPEAHHLHTPVSGRLTTPRTVLDVGGLLHPTPAVCGVPREAAQDFIARREPERGWYAGAVGWMHANGDGELAVALRSVLIDGRRLTVWAGAGIVDGSDADAELAETEAKMTALFRGAGTGAVDERAA